MLALLGWQLGHGNALQPWPSTLSITLKSISITWLLFLFALDQIH